MREQKHTKHIVIIGDGYSDYVVLRQFVSAIFNGMDDIHLNFPDYNLLKSLNIERSVNKFVIAFPDLMTYSYIKKIKPQNKFGTKRRPQNNMHSNPAAK